MARKRIRFPQIRGKTVKDVEFFTAEEFHSISVRFEDGTALELEILPAFALPADYSDWPTGDGRFIKRWRR